MNDGRDNPRLKTGLAETVVIDLERGRSEGTISPMTIRSYLLYQTDKWGIVVRQRASVERILARPMEHERVRTDERDLKAIEKVLFATYGRAPVLAAYVRTGHPLPNWIGQVETSVRRTRKHGCSDKHEANKRAIPILEANPRISSRALAKKIDCSHGWITDLPAWRTVRDALNAGRAPRAERLTQVHIDSIGTRDDALARLVKEQGADMAADVAQERRAKRKTNQRS